MLKRLSLTLSIALLVALAVPPMAEAAGTTANLSWSAPTQYVDGTALPASDIAFYTVQFNGQSQKVTAPATTASVNVACGSASFTVTVTTTATAKYPNATSDPSGAVPYASGVVCRPKVVTGVTVS